MVSSAVRPRQSISSENYPWGSALHGDQHTAIGSGCHAGRGVVSDESGASERSLPVPSWPQVLYKAGASPLNKYQPLGNERSYGDSRSINGSRCHSKRISAFPRDHFGVKASCLNADHQPLVLDIFRPSTPLPSHDEFEFRCAQVQVQGRAENPDFSIGRTAPSDQEI